MAFDHIISHGNFSSVFSAHFLDERANKLHKVVGDQVVAKVIPGGWGSWVGCGGEEWLIVCFAICCMSTYLRYFSVHASQMGICA